MESTLKNMLLTLLIITLVASAAVGVVYKMTEEPIAAAKAAKTTGALGVVLPAFDNNPADEMQTVELDGLAIKVYTARSGQEVVGYAVETATKRGFNGEFRLMVGFKPDGAIYNIEVLEQNETPGLGDKIQKSKSDFSLQFAGKSPETFKLGVRKDGGDVEAITAATISSRAFCDAVERAYAAYKSVALGVTPANDGTTGATTQSQSQTKESDSTTGAATGATTQVKEGGSGND